MINSELLDTILLEWSYRLKDGIPDVNDSEKVKVLNDILYEHKLPLYEGAETANESEGLTVYFSSLSSKELTEIENNLKLANENKKYKPSKLPTDSITANYYGLAVKAVKTLVDSYNKGSVQKTSVSRYANSLSMAKYIHAKINSPGNVICDRGELFSAIKERAHEIGKTAGISDLREDKWCPADIFIYANGSDPDIDQSYIDSILAINVKIGDTPALNDLFIDTFSAPGAKKILGVSLKEAKAQGGKAKSFSKTLKRGVDYPEELGQLTKEQTLQKDISFYLDFILENFNSNDPSKRASTITYAVRAKKLMSSNSSNKFFNKIIGDLNAYLETAIGKQNINASDTDAKTIYKQNPKALKVPNSLSINTNAYYSDVLDTAYKFYSDSRQNLFSELESSGNYELESKTKIISKTEINSPQILLKKAACYQVAQELILGLNLEEFSMPALYTNIAKDTNAFVALTAFAIGYTGVSPTFFKLVGSDKLGGSAHAEKFDGSGTLVLPETSSIEVIDSPNYKGFQAKFTVDVEIEGKTAKSYEILLSFRYSEITISIETAAPKEK